MKYKIMDLIDVSKQQNLLDSFCDAVGVAAAIIDLKGNVLVGSRWQRICTDFHRMDKETCAKCIESDTQLANELKEGKPFSIYSCKNGLTDAASPVIIEGEHMANVFVGQFLLDPPDLDFFLGQVAQYSFDEISYLDALAEVPLITKERLPFILEFLTSFAEMIANMGLKQIEALEAQDDLKLNQTFLSSLINTLPDLVWLKDPEGRYLACNSRFESFFGAKEKNIIGKTDYDFLDKEASDFFRNNDKAAIAKGKPSKNEEKISFAEDGHSEILETIKTPMFGNNGQLIGVLGIGRDITKRKQAEEELRDSHSFNSSLLEYSPNAILVYNPDTSVRYVNLLFEKLTGYKTEEVIGAKLPYPWWVDDPDYGTFEQRRKLGFYEPYSDERRYRKKNGDYFWVIMAVTPIFHNNEFIYSLSTWVDISERKKSEREKEKLRRQLQQAQKMESIGTLAGGVAHDFNNLLMGIQGRTSLMKMEMDLPDTLFEHIQGIEECVKSATDLTKQLLGFARGGKYEVKPMNLNDLVKNVSQMFGRTKKEISIHHKLQENIWTIEADKTQIEQVLLNIFVNAWQAMPTGGDIYIHTENRKIDEDYVKSYSVKPGNYVKISITDTGHGMDEMTSQKIFEPFFSTKGMGKGTGLGLASAYGIIKNHDGIINVYSEKGKGATFNIYLPATEKELIEEKKSVTEILKGSETVLLVDDEQTIIDVGEQILEKLGYKVIVANSGRSAIQLYQENFKEIDIVILDMIMPDINGGETYNRLKSINHGIKVLLSSGYSINGQAEEIMYKGCSGFIQKPFSINDLSKKIREILDKD